MGKNVIDYAIPIGLGALTLWNPAAGAAAEGAAGAAEGAAAVDAGLLGNAFGSADMMAAGAAGGTNAGLLGGTAVAAEVPMTAVNEAGESVTAYGPNGEYFGKSITDGGMKANPYTGGYDSKGFVERGLDRLGGAFDGGFKMPQFGQQQQTRPAAIANQVKPFGRNAQQSAPSEMPYGQYLTPEEMWQRELLRQRGY